jgi:hypothetical protein
MTVQDDKNFLLIEFEYNGREIDGIEEFKNELKENYHLVQGRSRHISAASQGGEFWLTVFINSPIGEFLIQNITWDIFKYGVKKMFLRPLIDSLKNLEKANKKRFGLRIIKLKLQFDDTSIYIGGVNGNFTSIIGTVFQKLFKLMNRFKSEVDLPLTSIELPLHFDSRIDKPGYSKYIIDTFHDSRDSEYYIRQWKLTYYNGLDCKIYDFKDDKFMNCL